MNKISHNHHFIPQFFINGFIFPKTMIWIYDKSRDCILPNPRSPKSIFFENNRNSIMVAGREIDIIETQIYKYLDNLLGKRFNLIQRAPINEIQNDELIHCINIMLATAYYRTPSTEHLITNYTQADLDKISSPMIKDEMAEIFKLKINETDRNKLLKCVTPFINSYIFDDTLANAAGFYKICETPVTCFILSDNPIIYESPPKDFYESTYSVVFPLTSNRIYYGLRSKTNSFNDSIVKLINLILADQADRYFGCQDKTFLETIVKAHRKSKYFLDTEHLVKELFIRVNN